MDASERKALERSVTDLSNRVKVARGVPGLHNDLSEAAWLLKGAREKLATFDRDLMDE